MCLIIPNCIAQGKYSPNPFGWSVYVIKHMGWWPLQHSFASVDNVTAALFYCPINTMSSLKMVLHSSCVSSIYFLVSSFHILTEHHQSYIDWMNFRKQVLKMTEASNQGNMLKVTGAKFTVQTLSHH